MHAEVISIGDELTSGQRLDTNSQWLSTRLGELGVKTIFHTTVADDLTANIEVLRRAAERADLVIATGGLGPTADDLTRDALAAAAGVDLVLDHASLAHIENLFSKRKRPMPSQNRLQAMFPRGSRAIPNPAGTAPGIDFEFPRPGNSPARIFALPGVPAEMREMWEQTVAPAIAAILGAPRVIRHRRIKCFGAGESDVEAMLPDLIRRGREPQVGITVHDATITLRITAHGDTPEECFKAMEPTVATIHQCLGTLVFGEGDDELEHAVARLLAARKKTLTTAEIGSGGMIADWLSATPLANDCFLGGLVVRTDEACRQLLDKSADDLAAIAEACRAKFDADFGLAVGKLPPHEPQGAATQFTQPPLLHFAVADRHSVWVKSSPYIGHPDILKTRGAKQALNLLRLTLLSVK